MPRPTAVSVAQFRSFRRPVTMELRPLTLLYGPNNVGKSALLRILPLIGESLAPGATVPLVLTGPAGRGAAFSDVLWAGDRDSDEVSVLTIGLDFPPERGVSRVEFEIHALDANRNVSGTPIVRAFSVWKDTSTLLWRAQRLVADNEDPAAELPFEISFATNRTRSVKIRFEGLIPFSKSRLSGLGEVRRALEELRGRVQWLTAPRVCEERIIPEPIGASPGLLPPRGDVAVLQALRADPRLAEQVSLWYRAGGGDAATKGAPREIRFEPVPPSHFRALMATPGTSRLAVNIVDAGAGWVQLLPVLTVLALADQVRGPRIVAIEEPESNLHPSAQRAIAEALVDVVRRRREACLVLETHSYPLLQYLQLQIIAGHLPVDDVVAYWVSQSDAGESQLVRGTFDAEGRISSNWPSSAFIESLDLAREIADARRKRSR